MNPFSFSGSPPYFGTATLSGGPTTLMSNRWHPEQLASNTAFPAFAAACPAAAAFVPRRLLRVFRPGRRRLHGQESDPVLVGVSDRRIVVHEHSEKHQDIQGEYPGARPAFPLPGGKGKDQADRQR